MKVVYQTCCGVDVHKSFLVATIIKTTSGVEPSYQKKRFSTFNNSVFCKHFLEKNAKYFWRMLHLQIGESCKASAGSYSASYIAIADHI